MSHQPIVKVESLTHRYGERVALNGVSFAIDRPCLFALLGPNGCGKTTLFRILATLLRPSEGTASVADADVVVQRARVLERIGVVFQKPALDGKLTVLENLIYQGQLYGLKGRALRQRSRELLERFDVFDRAHDRVDVLSGGLARRVELAKGLLHRPDVLILDEPSTGLDPGARLTLTDYLKELRDTDGVTSLLTTHLMDEADQCDRVGVMDVGRLVALDDPSALKRTIGGDVLSIGASEIESLRSRLRDRLSVEADVVDGILRFERERGHEFVPQLIEAFPGEIESVTVGKPTLEDVFVHLTGHGLWDGNTSAVDKK